MRMATITQPVCLKHMQQQKEKGQRAMWTATGESRCCPVGLDLPDSIANDARADAAATTGLALMKTRAVVKKAAVKEGLGVNMEVKAPATKCFRSRELLQGGQRLTTSRGSVSTECYPRIWPSTLSWSHARNSSAATFHVLRRSFA